MLSLIRIQKLYNYEENQMSLMEMISDFFPLKKSDTKHGRHPTRAVCRMLYFFYVFM